MHGNALLARRVSTALTAGTVMLALALLVVVALIVRPDRSAHPNDIPAGYAGTATP